jgi:hypothetical protein
MSSHACMVWFLVWGMVMVGFIEKAVDGSLWRGAGASQERTKQAPATRRKLSHEETLKWVAEHKAWKLARKTRPIWARPVEAEEVGKEFQTADHAKEVARQGFWLCVGIAGEPWFQALEKIEAKYEHDGDELRKFDFDVKSRAYWKYKPKLAVRNWAAQVSGPDIEGFSIRPGYDPKLTLYSPAGGYVIKDDVKDPYGDDPKDVWLVQEALFKSTYEIVNDTEGDGFRRDHGCGPK